MTPAAMQHIIWPVYISSYLLAKQRLVQAVYVINLITCSYSGGLVSSPRLRLSEIRSLANWLKQCRVIPSSFSFSSPGVMLSFWNALPSAPGAWGSCGGLSKWGLSSAWVYNPLGHLVSSVGCSFTGGGCGAPIWKPILLTASRTIPITLSLFTTRSCNQGSPAEEPTSLWRTTKITMKRVPPRSTSLRGDIRRRIKKRILLTLLSKKKRKRVEDVEFVCLEPNFEIQSSQPPHACNPYLFFKLLNSHRAIFKVNTKMKSMITIL